jgi:hypothetical protein
MSTRPDALFNLADAMAEDILNTPDDEVLREVEEDFGDPRALANKFDQILERAEKQVFGTSRSASSPQVRSSVLDLPIIPDETIRWVKGIFDLGSRVSEFLSSLRPRTLAWSATAAAVVILVQAAVITAVLVKEQGASSGPSLATIDPRATQPLQTAAEAVPVQMQGAAFSPSKQSLSDEEIAALVAGGRQLMVAGDIPNARLVLQQAAEADNATAALELGATYDPTFLQQLKAAGQTAFGIIPRATGGVVPPEVAAMTDMGDVRMARLWYAKAKDLGSTEAAVRLERLRSVPDPRPGAMSDD